MEKVMMKLGGLSCPSCLTKIQKSVESAAGTDGIKVLFNAGKVKFNLDPTQSTTDDIKTGIEKMGYTVQGIKTKEL
ncbi:MAG: heavy-metal-associated domain-containing protein [Limosilactobacillus sp.]|jgi:copper chaperone CopZ|uniref:heavy-metal-associated domain-containing protein n=1 Tax=Limosilactobacillus sp. TaxID=2773925 RepID=UPI0025C63107|nr:heavy-metal-associated domain-containing protein [Limosilactobacillus sp.]MCI1975008.1 heavy-metal-associated domain-containing protein [Limosilactobacillus sp.]MCI2030498.1 heavy-metal-associated domain-containing protein [Limosilactobacillus sp.]